MFRYNFDAQKRKMRQNMTDFQSIISSPFSFGVLADGVLSDELEIPSNGYLGVSSSATFSGDYLSVFVDSREIKISSIIEDEVFRIGYVYKPSKITVKTNAGFPGATVSIFVLGFWKNAFLIGSGTHA